VDTDGPPPSSPITEPFMPQQCSKLQKRGHPAWPQEFLCDVARNVRADRSSSKTNQLHQMQDICSAPDKAHPVHYTFLDPGTSVPQLARLAGLVTMPSPEHA
jgi:hypothetical protein